MTKTKGYRRGTRDMFSRQFRKHGVINLSTFMKTYKIGDYVDVKVSVLYYLLKISTNHSPRIKNKDYVVLPYFYATNDS
jgi:hypothetical protein